MFHVCVSMHVSVSKLTLAHVRLFTASSVKRERFVEPPAVRPLMELELRRSNKQIVFDERKSMIPNVRVPGQPVTSEVRSNPQSRYWKRASFADATK